MDGRHKTGHILANKMEENGEIIADVERKMIICDCVVPPIRRCEQSSQWGASLAELQ